MPTATQLILETIVKGTEQARAQIAGLSNSVQNFAEKTAAAGKALTAGVTLPVVGLGANMVKIAADVAESQSKFDAVFQDMADSSRSTFDQMAKDVGRSSLKLQDMGGSLGALAKGFGATNKEAAALGAAGVQAALDLASFNNSTDAEALTAYRSALTGEAEPMKRFGIDVSQTGLALEAQRLGLNKSIKEMSQFEKATLVASKVAYQMGSQGSLGDAARTSESFANRSKQLADKIYELQASFGEIIKNAVSPFLGYAIKLVDAFQALDEPTKTMIVRVAAIAAAIGPALLVISGITSAFTKMLNPMNLVIAGIGALVAWFGNAYLTNEDFRKSVDSTFSSIITTVSAAFETIKSVVTTIAETVTAVWETIREPAIRVFTIIKDTVTSFISRVVSEMRDWLKIMQGIFNMLWSVVGPIITTIVNFIRDNFDTIVAIVKNVANILFQPLRVAFDVIYGVIKAFFQFITGDFDGAWNTIKSSAISAWEGIKSFFSNILGFIGNIFKLAWNGIKDSVLSIWPTIRDGVSSGFTSVLTAVQNIGNSIVTFFTNLGKDAYNWGVNMIQQMVDGILSMPGKVADAVSGIASTISDYLGFSSPTKLGPGSKSDQWMPNLNNMLASGLSAGKSVISSAASGLAGLIDNTLKKSATNAGSTAKQIVSAVAAIPNEVMQLAGPMFDKINSRYNDFFARSAVMPDKLRKPFESMYNSFRDTSDKINESMVKLRDNLSKNLDDIAGKVSDAREELAKLKESYGAGVKADDLGLAKAIVDQQNKIDEMRKTIAEKQASYDAESVDVNRESLAAEISDLQSKLDKEERALRLRYEYDKDISEQIAEVKRRARQTDFENFMDDWFAKRQKANEEFVAERQALEQRIAMYDNQAQRMQESYRSSLSEIRNMQAVANRVYDRAINQQVLATEAGTNLMKQYFDEVTESVNTLADALGSVGEVSLPTADQIRRSNKKREEDSWNRRNGIIPDTPWYDTSYMPPLVNPPSYDQNIYLQIDTMVGKEEFAFEMGNMIARKLGLNNSL